MSKASDLLRSISGAVGVGPATKIPSIPTVPTTGDANVTQFLSALKQTIETWAGERGDSLDSAVTWRGLVDKQFATIDLTAGIPGSNGLDGLPVKPAQVNDLTPPPAPQNLVTSGALSTIILDWDTPSYGNHGYTEIWRSSEPIIGTAVRIGMAPGAVYADSVGGGFTYYYWIRFVSKSAVVGPYNATEGTEGSTSLDPGYLLEVLNGQISASELETSLNSRIELIDADASVPNSVAARVASEAAARSAAINAEATARTNAIAAETNARVAAVLNEENARISSYNTLNAAIVSETNSRVTAVSAEASARDTLATQLRGSYTGSDISQVTSGLIYTERTSRITGDQALQTQIDTLSAASSGDFQELIAAVQTEQTARIAGDTANATSISTLTTRLDNIKDKNGNQTSKSLEATIVDNKQAQIDADSALTSSINSLSSTVTSNYNTLNSAIQSEASTRATAVSAETTARETLATQLRGSYTGTDVAQLTTGLVYNERVARTSADGALSTSISSLQSTVTNNYNTLNSSITTEATTRANADTALTTSVNNLSATVTGNYNTLNSAISNEATARANADTALTTQINTVSAAAAKARTYSQTTAPTVGMVIGDLWFDTDDNNKAYRYSGSAWVATDDTRIGINAADIVTEAAARVSGDSANANLISQVQARLDTGDYAAVKVDASTALSKATGAEAKYSVKLDVDGYVSGFGLISTANNAAPTSRFIFKADQFAFGAPGLTSAYPFVIQATATTVNGVAVPAGVYIDAAYIKNGTLTNAKIGNAAIDSAKIADAAIVTAKIADASITSAKIRDAEITNAKIADAAITTAKIATAAIGTAQIAIGSIGNAQIADATIQNAKIATLDAGKITTGTFNAARIGAGTITADKISVTSLSAVSANLGEVTTGVARNSNWSSYLNLGATGNGRFLQCGGNVAINADGSGYFARSIVSAPNIIAQGTADVGWSGWIPWETNPHVRIIDTGVYVPANWYSASTNQYLATGTISSGISQNGGGMGFTKIEIVVGDGLVTYGGVWEDNRIFLKFTFEWSNGPGAIGLGGLQWKLCQV